MQGLWLDGRRPKSKKEVREALAADPRRVSIEATSWFGNEYDGPVTEAPDGSYAVVGPDPHTRRVFYGTVTVSGGKAAIK